MTALTIDMAALEYISSAGLRVLLSAQKVMNRQGEMKVLHVNETILDIFEVTGFSDILTIEKGRSCSIRSRTRRVAPDCAIDKG